MLPAEKRKTFRRTIRHPGTIEPDTGAEPIPCTLCDASQEGAQLQVDDPAAVPDDFTLVLGYDGTARRRCKVVWRTDVQVGVEFKKMQPVLSRTGGAASESAADDSIDIDSLFSR